MKDYSFIEVVLTDDSHVLLECDDKARKIFSGINDGALEERVTDKYRENFVKKLELADGKWFPARIIIGDETPLFYIKALRKKGSSNIKLILVSLDELLETHDELIRLSSSLRAQLDLYEDVFFEYDPETDVVGVFNTDIAKFDAGLYSSEEFEALLCDGIPVKSQKAVKNFIGQMKSKTGRFSSRVDSNVLNDDSGYTVSLMEGAYVFFYKGTESVVGHIHVGNGNGKIVASSIKRDSLTGLVDKADITRIAQERIDDRKLEGTTLAIIDIDFFKNINDTYGHQFGDTVIKRVADIIAAEVGNSGIAGRFGGDEFLVVFYNVEDETDLRDHLRRMFDVVKESFPDKGADGNSPLTLSIGTATYPKDATSYEDVFMVADYCLYLAKEKGRNRYIIYTPEKHASFDEIMAKTMTTRKFNDRGELSYGDMLINMFDTVLHGPGASVENLIDEFAVNFGIQHIQLFVGKPFEFRYSAGTDNICDTASRDMLTGFLNSPVKDKYMAGRKFIVVNKIDHMPPQAEAFKIHLKEIGVYSFMFICFSDADDNECVMLISSIGKYTQWNEMHYKYYRGFGDILACCRCKNNAIDKSSFAK
ncbi:GGDEF domain-containing protein [Butyrivibrio sp. XPD2006]|uniref:GGDEF domain-containing protein n=1 Tax=Butyrivibrio sp. XPD2006 TaxID=1280668 RepID=UPI0003B76F48|nr:GGDEF domain-containing protein [Butyrivibrio sp. XPD2006]